MAPPRHRGRGFSRRIQYRLFFGYVAAAAGIVACLALLLIARFDPLVFQGIRGLALDVTAPVSGVTGTVARGGTSVREEVRAYWNAAAQNRALRAELEAARRGLIAARVVEAENRRLARIARLVDGATPPLLSARIVGSDASGVRRFATLAAGSADGVRPGQPVRGPDGLVGRIAETGAHAARVILLTDGGSSVPLFNLRTRQPALAEGRGEPLLALRSTIAGAQPFRRGDLLVTSGVGGVFPPGLPVAVVVDVAGEVASARPFADPARLDFAAVLPERPMPPPPALPEKPR